MNEAQKAKLGILKTKGVEALSEIEKTEYDLLITIEKQAGQITEANTLLGTKGTELDTLKTKLESATGADKTALEAVIADKSEALEIAKAGLKSMETAQALIDNAAKNFSEPPGHGDTVSEDELSQLQAKAMGDADVKADVEAAYANMTTAEKLAFKYAKTDADKIFKEQVLKDALGGSEIDDDSPWGTVTKKDEEPAKTAEERLDELFGRKQEQHRRMPPNSTGRGGRGKRVDRTMPKARVRAVDTRSM